MDIVNRLYEVSPTSLTSLENPTILQMHKSVLAYNDNQLEIILDANTVTLNRDKFNIINAYSSDYFVTILCSSKTDLKYKHFCIVHDIELNSSYVLTIHGSKDMHTKNTAMMVVNKILFIIDDDNRLISIDLKNLDTLQMQDIGEYPTDKKYVASIEDIALIDTDATLCNNFLFYDSKLYLTIAGTNQFYTYDTLTTIVDKDRYKINFIIQSIDSKVQIGLENDYGKEDVVAIFTSNNYFIIMDMEDLNGSIMKEYNDKAYVRYSGTDIYIIAEEFHQINTKSIAYEKPFVDFTTKDCLPISLGDKLILKRGNDYEEVNETKVFSVVNVNCINEDGKHLDNYNELYALNRNVTITAKNVQYHSVVGNSSYEITTTEPLYNIEFRYRYSAKLYPLNVHHICDDFELTSYVLNGREGEEYRVVPLTINGFLYDNSTNSVGVFGPNMDNECIVRYRADDGFIIDRPNRTYMCVKCYCEDELMFEKYIPTIKGNNIVIPSPEILCYTPTEPSVMMPQINFDIQETRVDYVKKSESIITTYMYKEEVIYECVSKVVDGKALLNPPPYISLVKNVMDTLGRKRLLVHCDINKELTIMNIIRVPQKKTLYRIIEIGDKRIMTKPNIYKYQYLNEYISDKYLLTLHSLTYKQNMFTINVIHKHKETILQQTSHIGKDGEVLNVTPYQSDTLTTFDDLEFTFGPTDKDVTIQYETKKNSIVCELYDIDEDKIVKTDIFKFEIDEEIRFTFAIPEGYKILYKDTLVNQEVAIDVVGTKWFKYIATKTQYPYNVKYQFIPGAIQFKHTTKANQFITILTQNETETVYLEKKIYVTKKVDKSNASTRQLLDSLGYEYEEIDISKITTIKQNAIIIDGDLATKTRYLSRNYKRSDLTYLPMDIEYVDFTKTLELATKDCCLGVDRTVERVQVEDTISVGNMMYNKNNRRLFVGINHTPSSINMVQYECHVYDVKELKEVHSEVLNVNTISNFLYAAFTFNEQLNSEPSVSNVTNVDTISYRNTDEKEIIDTVLHCYLIDVLGNRTKTIHEPIIYNIFAEQTESTYKMKYFNHNMTAYNHRFRGPRESYKFHNHYAHVETNLKAASEYMDEMFKNIEYDDTIILEDLEEQNAE